MARRTPLLATRKMTHIASSAEWSFFWLHTSCSRLRYHLFDKLRRSVWLSGTCKMMREHILQGAKHRRCGENRNCEDVHKLSWPSSTSEIYKSVSKNDHRRRILNKNKPIIPNLHSWSLQNSRVWPVHFYD